MKRRLFPVLLVLITLSTIGTGSAAMVTRENRGTFLPLLNPDGTEQAFAEVAAGGPDHQAGDAQEMAKKKKKTKKKKKPAIKKPIAHAS